METMAKTLDANMIGAFAERASFSSEEAECAQAIFAKPDGDHSDQVRANGSLTLLRLAVELFEEEKLSSSNLGDILTKAQKAIVRISDKFFSDETGNADLTRLRKRFEYTQSDFNKLLTNELHKERLNGVYQSIFSHLDSLYTT